MNINAIKRVNEFIDPELLEDSELTELKNMVLDGGKAIKRGALKSYNKTSASGSIKQLYELEDTLLGLVDVGSTRTLKSSTGGAWTTIKSGLNDSMLRGLQYGSRAYFTNGVDAPFVTDGSTSWDLALPKPDLSSVITYTLLGGNLDASKTYRYAIAYLNDKGEIGDYSLLGHRITGGSYSTDSSYKNINITGLPISTRADVTGRRIFRTEGDGAIFYLLTDLDNVTTYYRDNIADEDLDTTYILPYTNVPTKAKYTSVHKERMFLANVTSNQYNAVTKPAKVDMSITTDRSGGDYLYYAVSYLDSYGKESILSDSTRVTLDKLTNYTNTLEKIPKPFIGSAYRDPSIIKIRLYRSEDNTTFYWIKDIDSTNTDWYTDLPYLGTTDAHLSNGAAYSNPTSIEYANRVYYSDVIKLGQINELNYVDVYSQDNEAITGIVDQQDGVLVFKEKSICFIYTSGSPYNWRVVKLIENIGCSNSDSIQRAKNTIYFQYNQDFYSYPSMELVSQTFKDTLSGITVLDTAYVSKYNWYVILASNNLYIYDERNQTWYNFTISSSTMASVIETIDKVFYIGLSSGETLKYDTASTLDFNSSTAKDETTISVSLKSKHFTTPKTEQLLRLRKLFSNFYLATNSVTQKIVETRTNLERSATSTSGGWKEYKGITDGLTGTLKTGRSFRYEISGDVSRFNSMRLEGTLLNSDRI